MAGDFCFRTGNQIWFLPFSAYFCGPSKGKVRCLSGRKERFAKPSYGLNCTEGSNPSLTAGKS